MATASASTYLSDAAAHAASFAIANWNSMNKLQRKNFVVYGSIFIVSACAIGFAAYKLNQIPGLGS